MWLFLLAWYLYLILKSVRTTDTRNGTLLRPQFLAGNTIQIFAFTDACVGIAVEFAILAHGIQQGRLSWLGRMWWLIRHGVMFVITALGAAVLWTSMDIKELDWSWKPSEAEQMRPKDSALTVCFGYWFVRIGIFMVLNMRMGRTTFVPGRPSARKNPEVSGLQGAERRSVDDGNAGAERERSRSSGYGLLNRLEEFVVRSDDWRHHLYRHLVWACMLGGCFVFEVFFIAPLAADFDSHEFCKISCTAREEMAHAAPGAVLGLPDFFSVSNDCWACRGTLVLTWALVGLTGFFDIYYMFYFGTAVVGYGMGEMRGLRNVLSTALRYLDFTTRGTSIKTMSTSKRMQQFSDGELMCRVFGTSWRIIWSRLVESLYEECLITAKERDNFVKAAGTMPWSKRQDAENFKPGDTFKSLKFVSTASRGSNRVLGADVGHERTKCISGLLIRTERNGEVHVLKVPEEEFVTKEVHIATPRDRDRVQGALLQDNKDNPELSVLEVTGPVELVSCGEMVVIKEKWRIVGVPDSAVGSGHTEDELLTVFAGLTDFPAKVVFRTTAKYNECIVRLETPCRVHSVSFLKTHDDPASDPVQWRVEGLQTADGVGEKDGRWKQLVWQDTTIEPRSHGRGEPTEEWFEVECWRQKMRSPDSVDFNDLDPVVAERLGFFTASLQGIMDNEDFPVRHGVDSLMDSHIGNVPSLSQIIPVYGETIILDEKTLMQSDGVNTNLGFIISQFDDEWDNLAKRFNKEPDSLYHAFASGSLREKADSEDKQHAGRAKEAADLIMEIRLWASMRSQTVARTVVGAIQYHEVLTLLPGIKEAGEMNGYSEPPDEGRVPREKLEKCVELILAHQTYGQKRKDDKKGPADSDKDVQYLLKKYSDKPFYLVLDYNEKTAEAGMQQKVLNFLHTQYQYSGRLQYASVLARWRQFSGTNIADEDGLEIVDVLPRRFPLLVGEGDFRTQGKAGNQLGALRFARGHYLQMMDSNMGAFLGEACKVPFVLRRFCPFNFNRASVTARIIGFREFIFTERHGTVGNIMASAEFSFGTICQRFLAGLGARMHYGHPDFLDGFWASNRGSLSKASPSINLSEDIFAGFNVAMRGERSEHVDTLAWEKGREVSFNSSSLFFSKVSGGNAGVMRSRDLKIISENLGIIDNFSFYFASIGFYLNNLLIDKSVILYVFLFVLLSLSSKTLDEVGDRYSLLASEWCLSMGIVAMFPRFMELTLEYGILEGLLRFVPSVPGCMTMFTFINKSIASSVEETMTTGKANYISTGRPNANTHYGWRECYFIFCKSHYYPALKVCYSYSVYFLLARELKLDSLPMMVLMVSVLLWIVAPIIFCPQPTTKTLANDLSQFWQFCIASPKYSVRKMPMGEKTTEEMLHAAISNPRSSLYEYWLLEELKAKQTSLLFRVLVVLKNAFQFVLFSSVVHTNMLDQMFTIFGIFIAQLLLMEIWRLLYRPTALMLVNMLIGTALPLWWMELPVLDFMVVFAVFNYGLRCILDLALLLGALFYKPDNSWTKWETTTEEERALRRQKQHDTRRYDTLVEYFFVSFQQHLQHLYCAMFILLLNLCAQLPMVLLDVCGGLHSGLLLNFNLSGPCGSKRTPFEPVSTTDGSGRPKGRRRGSSLTSSFLLQRWSRGSPRQPPVPQEGSFEMRNMTLGQVEVGGPSSRHAAQQSLLRGGTTAHM
uniref:Glycosyl transferase 48 domain-containing protein n=1 Tax=Alexandrium monilatum TaxID=311494 RepID=A0A7S4PXL8_9DINO